MSYCPECGRMYRYTVPIKSDHLLAKLGDRIYFHGIDWARIHVEACASFSNAHFVTPEGTFIKPDYPYTDPPVKVNG